MSTNIVDTRTFADIDLDVFYVRNRMGRQNVSPNPQNGLTATLDAERVPPSISKLLVWIGAKEKTFQGETR